MAATQLKFNQPVQTWDVAETLKNEHGTFLCQRAGQLTIITAKEGHSIASMKPVGTVEQINPMLLGSNPPYVLTRIDDLGSEDEPSSRNR